MYELKAHAKLNKHIDKAEALVTKFRNQKPPENATREQVEQWEKNKLTPKKVLAVIRRYITSQNTVPRKGSGIGEDLIRLQTETICSATP